MTDPRIEKLPKWAQDHIADIQRQRDVSVRELNEYIDKQTPSPFFVDEMVCTGEETGPTVKRNYIQTRRVSVEHAGVSLDVYIRDEVIELTWGDGEYRNGDVAMIPVSRQQVHLKSQENMRTLKSLTEKKKK